MDCGSRKCVVNVQTWDAQGAGNVLRVSSIRRYPEYVSKGSGLQCMESNLCRAVRNVMENER